MPVDRKDLYPGAVATIRTTLGAMHRDGSVAIDPGSNRYGTAYIDPSIILTVEDRPLAVGDAEAEADRFDPRLAYDDFSEAIRMIEVPVKPTGRVGSDDAAYAYQCAEAIGVALGAVAEFAERLTRSCDHAAGRKLTPRGDFTLWRERADQYLAEPLRDIARRECDDRPSRPAGRVECQCRTEAVMTELEILSMYEPDTIGIFLLNGVSKREAEKRHKLILSMEDRGLLTWLPDPFGGFRSQWAITEKGREHLAAALPRKEGE